MSTVAENWKLIFFAEGDDASEYLDLLEEEDEASVNLRSASSNAPDSQIAVPSCTLPRASDSTSAPERCANCRAASRLPASTAGPVTLHPGQQSAAAL